MDELTRVALVGTSKTSGGVVAQGSVADAGVEDLKDISAEEQVLLRAGARSLYSQAGFKPLANIKPLETPAADTLLAISSTAEQLLARAWDTESGQLIQSFLREMQKQQRILSPSLLTRGLSARDSETRELVRPLLGNRGRWLAALNAAWARILDEAAASPDEAERIKERWNDSSTVEQLNALRSLRKDTPAVARDLVASSFASSSAEVRSRLLTTFQINLSADDEAFLESCLDDRSTGVRELAASLLVKIPQSACARRMQERADAILAVQSKGILRKKQTLVVKPPKELSKEDERDSIPKKAPGKGGQRAFWTSVILSRVPLDHWTALFELSPAALVAAVDDDEYRDDVLQGWAIAACESPGGVPCSAEWAQALIDTSIKSKLALAPDQLSVIARSLPAPTAAKAMEQVIFRDKFGEAAGEIRALVEELPVPWSTEFALMFLRRMAGKKEWSDHQEQWLHIALLSLAEVGLPVAMLPELTKFVASEERTDRVIPDTLRSALVTLEERVRLRADFQNSLTR